MYLLLLYKQRIKNGIKNDLKIDSQKSYYKSDAFINKSFINESFINGKATFAQL